MASVSRVRWALHRADDNDGLYLSAIEAKDLKDSELARCRVLFLWGMGEETLAKDDSWPDRLLRIVRARYTGPPAAMTVLKSPLSMEAFVEFYGQELVDEAKRQQWPWLNVITKDGLVTGPSYEQLYGKKEDPDRRVAAHG